MVYFSRYREFRVMVGSKGRLSFYVDDSSIYLK